MLETEAGFSLGGANSGGQLESVVDAQTEPCLDLDQKQALKRKRKKREEQKKTKQLYRLRRRQRRAAGVEEVSDSSSEDENDTDYDSGKERDNPGGTGKRMRPSMPLLRGKGTIIFPDDSRYDGHFINGTPNGLHGFKISPSGQGHYGTFDNGRCLQRELVEGISWRLIVYKCKGYRSGSRIRDTCTTQ